MIKLNNKGFSLVEVLAVVVILGILAVIMFPVVNNIITENKENNYNNLKNSILSGAKTYISDNRYNIELTSSSKCINSGDTRNISKIGDRTISDSKIPVSFLTDYLSSNNIINPKDDKKLIMSESYVIVKYDCDNRDYTFTIDDSYLVWGNS